MSETLEYLDRQHRRRRLTVAVVIVITATVGAILYALAPTPCTHFTERACMVEGRVSTSCSELARTPEAYLGPGVTEGECRAADAAMDEAVKTPLGDRKAAMLKVIRDLRATHPVIR